MFSVTKISDYNFCYSYLIHFDGLEILVNCGTDEYFNPHFVSGGKNIVPDILLLTSSELCCLGNIVNVKCRTLCTIPIRDIGQITATEQCRVLGMDPSSFEEAFKNVETIKYSQTVEIDGIKIVCYNSGNTLGGAVWKISKDEFDFFAGFDINHRRENHTDGFSLNTTATYFLTNSRYALKEHVSRKNRDTELLSLVKKKISLGKKVLIEASYQRILEVLLILEDLKKKEKAVVFGFQVKNFHAVIKTLLEYSGEAVMERFSKNKENPYLFNSFVFVEKFKDIPKDGKLFITPSLNSPMGIKILDELNNSENLLIFTENLEAPRRFEGNPLNLNVRENILEAEKTVWFDHPHEINRLVIKEILDNDFNFSIPFPTFSIYFDTIDKKISKVKNKEKSESSHEEKDEKWTSKFVILTDEFDTSPNTEVFLTQKYKFPDDYGHKIILPKFTEKKTEIEEESIKPQDLLQEKENVEYKERKKIDLKIPYTFVDYEGISDTDSIKTILKTTPIFIGPDKEFMRIFHSDQALALSNTIQLKDNTVTTHPLSSTLMALPTQSINNYQVTLALVQLQEKLEGSPLPLQNIAIGNFKTNELRKKIADKNLRATVENQIITVEKQIKIFRRENTIEISGELNDLFEVVRECVYESVVFL